MCARRSFSQRVSRISWSNIALARKMNILYLCSSSRHRHPKFGALHIALWCVLLVHIGSSNPGHYWMRHILGIHKRSSQDENASEKFGFNFCWLCWPDHRNLDESSRDEENIFPRRMNRFVYNLNKNGDKSIQLQLNLMLTYSMIALLHWLKLILFNGIKLRLYHCVTLEKF